MWRGSGVRSVPGAHRRRRADGPKLAWGVRKVHAHRAATLWPGEDAVAVLDYEAEGWPAGSPSRNYGEAPLGGRMACNTVVEDLTADELQDDECIEVRAMTTVKKSVANHPRRFQTKANHRGRILSRTASAAQGLRQRARCDSNAELRFPPPGRALIEWDQCRVAESMRTRSMITRQR